MSFLISDVQGQSTLVTSLQFMFNTFIALFVTVDPFAAVPVYLLMTERFNKEGIRATRRKAVFVALGLLLLFAATGTRCLDFFGISIPALRIAGGILLLLFALTHMLGSSEKINHDEEDEVIHRDNIAIVPLAMPLLAGPGSITTVIVGSTTVGSWLDSVAFVLSIVLVMWTSYLTLKYSQYLFKILGKTGLNLLGRIMGILIAAMAIEFILKGLHEAFPKV